MPTSPLELTRAQILAFRRRAGALDERLPRGARSLRRAAWAGLTDSVPRAALLSIHARVEGTQPGSWEDPSLIQVWGPRYSVYVVPARDRAVFTLGRLPDDARRRARAEDMAARVHAHLAGRRLKDNDVQKALGIGDAYYLYWGAGRELLVPDAAQRVELWTSRVWPGAVLVAGEIIGTWRRAQANLSVQQWRRLTRAERDAVEAEAHSLPLPGIEGEIAVRWDG